MRRTWLRGRENVHKRYLIHVAGHNLGLLMRLLIGAGTPKEAVASGWCFLVLLPTGNGAYEALIMVLVANRAMPALIVFRMAFDPPPGRNNHFVNGLLSWACEFNRLRSSGVDRVLPTRLSLQPHRLVGRAAAAAATRYQLLGRLSE